MIDTTRRALIAAIPAVAAVATLPAAALAIATPADRREWEHALARYIAAKQASDDFDERFFDPAFEREQAFERSHGIVWGEPEWMERRSRLIVEHRYLVPDDIGEEHERLVDAMCDAEHEVHQTPAPDLAALRWKLDRLFVIETNIADDEGCTPCWSAHYVRQAIADIVRLLPEGR